MQKKKYSSWRWLLAAGIILICISIYAFWKPSGMFLYFIKYTGYALIVSSFFLLIHAFTSPSKSEVKWLVCEGVIDLAVACILIFNPFLAVVAFPLLIACWVLTRAVIKLLHFISLSKVVNGRYYVLTAGILSGVVGIVILILPSKMIEQVSYGMSLFTLVTGVLYIVDAIKFKRNETMLAAIV
jgi:uncharacterized membrane protein HdeD (DUF308 family)